MSGKKIPQRMCVACREMKDKNELIRIVRPKDGAISPDFTGKSAGRGAYICKKSECILKAKKSRALERALGASAAEVYEKLIGELSEANNNE